MGHPPREGVDWNTGRIDDTVSFLRHPPREGVDWNMLIGVEQPPRYSSPSTWGCGLKFLARYEGDDPCSHPPREGVDWNSCRCVFSHISLESPSTWGCGLKFPCWQQGTSSFRVTLHVRVWIEIVDGLLGFIGIWVTLHVRVWIEIQPAQQYADAGIGHPPREGVDWNSSLRIIVAGTPSPSTWGCGLKLQIFDWDIHQLVSPSTWGCGLKYCRWIVTRVRCRCHPPREGVDWN